MGIDDDNSSNEQAQDEIDQRLGNLWSMTDKESKGCAEMFTLLFLLIIALLIILVYWTLRW